MLTQIPSSTLRQLVKLSEQKEKLLAQIQDVDREMVRLQRKHGIPTVAHDQEPPFRVKLPVRRGKRGALKEKILKTLRGAGKRGLTIGELSDKLGVRSANLYVWFNG